jgi:hypothetical protein
LFVVSAGVGLIHENDLVPAYDLTIAGRNSNIALTLGALGATTSDWWAEICAAGIGRGAIAEALRARPGRQALIALPARYLEMVSADLNMLSDLEVERLRVFTSLAGATLLPVRLQKSVMPYDGRLENLGGHAGTLADFPQRALRHFVESLKGHHFDLAAARLAVEHSLDGLTHRLTPVRSRVSDDAIAQILRKSWHAHNGSSTRLLRYVRREAGVACEQRRFRDIWRAVRAERSEARGA